MDMVLLSTVIKEGAIEMTYTDGLPPEDSVRLIVIRMPIEADPMKKLARLRREALLQAQTVLETEIAEFARYPDISL